jgi:hypothetical protein
MSEMAMSGLQADQSIEVDSFPAGCSKRPSSKAAGESKPEAYPQGYVEDFDELRTKLAVFFNSRSRPILCCFGVPKQ